LFKKAISAIGAIGAIGAMGAMGAIGAIGACGGSAFVLAGAPVLVKIVFVDDFFLNLVFWFQVVFFYQGQGLPVGVHS
jgi:hypothetical protein